ncbi:MAG: PorT family protein [Pseudoflavonifractor sp.]|nr:PorT family protein [Pseudoflavonifractor sp.]
MAHHHIHPALRLCLVTVALIVAMLTPLTSSAQKHYQSNFSIGAKAGATISRMEFSPSVKQSMVTGFIGGLMCRYMEEKHFGVIAELNIEQRGWKENFEGQSFTYERRLTYLQIPLMTHIYFGSRKFKGFVNLGPEIGFMIADGIKSNFDYRHPASVPGFPMANRMTEQMSMEVSNKFDYGISAGLGIEYKPVRRHSVTLEGRFYYGLGNIYPDNKRDTFAASRSMSIMATLAYWFRLK